MTYFLKYSILLVVRKKLHNKNYVTEEIFLSILMWLFA